jgi:hypothetical protein
MTVLFDGDIFADYHQFYLADARGWSIPDDWVDEAMANRIHCDADLLVVTTARDMNVPVRVELHDREPQIDTTAADHVVLGSVGSGGQLIVIGCTEPIDTAARIAVPSGNLRAMVVFSGLDTLSEDELDGEDRYVIHLWPSPETGVEVLRKWGAA